MILGSKLVLRFDVLHNKIYNVFLTFYIGFQHADRNLKYILAILNSKIGQYLLDEIRGVNNKDINPDYLKDIPIPEISLEEQQVFIDLADKMMELNKNFFSCKTPKDEKILKLQISKTDDKINQLVYEL